ncbi:hypothetical protein [Methylomicrobium sp. Wu6]|uniref:hypothetical protein n=1 Tax=Methylomicrobium sp. Wu6 TaxID=3107928 RepID=UPI002DD66D78|nr:hypothetical protein [Methylomicrobium sp. Wu6]MEC4747305.1 hypothetical protein [Methylomicrobium sp. Wu6]
MSPCVMVGPSSTTSTRLPRTLSGSFNRTIDAPRNTGARGFCCRTASATRCTSAFAAELTLPIRIMSAIRSTDSPG